MKYLLSFFIFCSILSYSQNYLTEDFKNINLEELGYNNVIKEIVQDRKGFIWLATNNGLMRYDGYDFKKYTSEFSILSARRYNFYSLYIDNSDLLWYSSNYGFEYLDKKNDKLIACKPSNADKNFPFTSIFAILEDGNNQLWLGTSNGLYLYNVVQNTIKHFKHNPQDSKSLINDSIMYLFLDSKNRFWISTKKGLDLLIQKSKSIEFEHHIENQLFFKDITSIEKFNSNLILSNYRGKLIMYNPEEKKIMDSIYKYKNNNTGYLKFNIEVVRNIDNQNLWMGFNKNDLVIYNFYSGKSTFITENFEIENGFNGNSIQSISQSKDKVIWVGTRTGLNIYDPLPFNIKHLKYNPEKSNSIPFYSITSIIKDKKNNIWFGYENSYISKYDPVQGKLTNYRLDIPNLYSIVFDDYDNMWISSSGSNYYVFDKNLKIKNFTFKKKANICKVGNKLYFIDTSSYFTEIDPINYSLKHIVYCPTPKTSTYINASNKNVFWINNNDSLIKLNILTKKLEFFKISNSEYPDLVINSIFISGDSILLATSIGPAIYFIPNDSVTFYPLKDIATNTDVRIIRIDQQKNIWFSTNTLIGFINKLNNNVAIFDSKLIYNNIKFTNYSFQLIDSLFYLGGKNGLSIFNPTKINIDTLTYNLVLSDIKINDSILTIKNWKNIKGEDVLILPYSHEKIKFKFALLFYKRNSYTQYYYQLTGIDKGWQRSYNINAVGYNQLSPGKYTFTVKAIDIFGRVFYSTPLSIIVKPPFWFTWWFFIIIIFLLIGSILFYNDYRLKKIKLDNKRLNEQVKIRTIEILEKNEELKVQNEHIEEQKHELEKLNATKDKLFSVIGHDLKNPFNAISGFASLLIQNFDEYPNEQKKQLLSIIKDSSDNAYQLLENLLQWSRANMNKIRFVPEKIDIFEIVNENINLLSILSKNKNISIENKVIFKNAFADRNMINTVLRNLIANSIKFTPSGGKITIESFEEVGCCKICVSDTGVGMTDEVKNKLFKINEHITTHGTEGEAGTGIGLILCVEFIERNNGKIWVESELNKGSKFFFTLTKF